MAKKLLVLVLLCNLPLLLRGTAQSGDRLIWQGRHYAMFSAPLEKLPNIDSLRRKIVLTPENKYGTPCGRGYVAAWEFKDGMLYLKELLGCMGNDVIDYAALLKLIPEYAKGDKLCASWYTGDLVLPLGDCIHEVHDGFMSIYEKERVVTVKNGKLMRDTLYDNGLSYKSVYTEIGDSLRAFVYSRINWQKIPDSVLCKKTIAFFKITTGINPRPDSLAFLKPSGCLPCDEEALRVLKLLPSWSVYYIARKKQYMPVYYNVPVFFREDFKRKYAPR